MSGNQEKFQKAMSKGHSAAWDQLWDKAASAYREALTEFPDAPKALSSLGLALYQIQEFKEALQTYQRLSEISPDDPIPFEKRAQLSERLGNLQAAVAAATKAADLYLSQKDVNKAIENWARVTQLDPENVLAHSRLALVHERLGNQQRAVTEYIALASLMQRSGKEEKAMDLLGRALKIMPGSQAAQQAHSLISSGQLLPKPIRPKGGTGPLRIAKVKQLTEPKKEISSSADPISEASKKSLMILAEILFEYSDTSSDQQAKKGLQAIMHGSAQLSLRNLEQTKVVLHLGQAIDAQSKNQDELAADELAHALLAGFEHPALYFNLGMLRSKGNRIESAMPHLQHAVKHADFGLAARLLMGQNLRNLGRIPEAATEYLEALKIADAMIVPEDQADSLRQLYEPLIEAQSQEDDEKAHLRLCENVEEMLMQRNWRENLRDSRKELPKSDGEMLMPLAEILIQAQSGQVLGAMARVHELARSGHARSAMDEAFQAITYAPTYLPLHSLIGDLLIKDDRKDEAIAKYGVIADAYGVRGEAQQSTVFLRKIIKLAPMDLSSRTKLIDQLTARGEIDDAIREYLNLADIYYRLAELDMARKTYTTALRAAQQGNAERSWNVHILQRMADIDMQRLDWRRAVRVFEQLRTLRPDDVDSRRNLIDLNLKLANRSQALSELDSYISYTEEHPSDEADILALLEGLIDDHHSVPQLHRMLGEEYTRLDKQEEAIKSFDLAAEMFIDVGEKDQAIKTINMILRLNPENADEYRKVLAQIQTG
jgi:tetratricopeptide (TPR) repeat protein